MSSIPLRTPRELAKWIWRHGTGGLVAPGRIIPDAPQPLLIPSATPPRAWPHVGPSAPRSRAEDDARRAQRSP
jgi:hypothetical protein